MMLFLIGERVSSKSEIAGSRFCAVCGDTEQFSHVTETNYFCLFGFPLLPTGWPTTIVVIGAVTPIKTLLLKRLPACQFSSEH